MNKSFISIFSCTLLILLLCTSSAFSQKKKVEENHKSKKTIVEDGKKYYLHTVDKKQTLFAIAKIYNLSVNDIVLENPDAIDGIKPGEVLKVPFDKPKTKEKETTKKPEEAKTKPTETATKPNQIEAADTSLYILDTVKKGQTLYSFSKQYGVSLERIKALNPAAIDGLKIGQVLRFPSDNKKLVVAKTEKPKEIKKEKEEKKEKPIEQKVAVDPVEIKHQEPSKDTAPPVVFKPELKNEYNIAFFLPFHADEVDAIDIDKLIKGDEQLPGKTSMALSFYEGALIAIDSLKKQKLNAKIYVYDLDDKDSLNTDKILKKPEVAKMDLMIGPLGGNSFAAVSKFAKEYAIPIVSPVIQGNKILFSNPLVCKVLPSTTLQVEQMAHYIVDSFGTQNIILVDNAKTKESSFLYAFKNTANAGLLDKGLSSADSVKQAKGLTGLEAMLLENKANIVVLPSTDQAYVTEFVRGLRNKHEKFKIILFGLQNWTTFDNLDFDYLNDLSLHITTTTFVDYQNSSTLNVINTYRYKYKTEPDMYVYQGFDISYYFISALQKQGTGFLKNLSQNKYQGIETNFQFKQYPSESGFENKYVTILKYQDFKLVKAN